MRQRLITILLAGALVGGLTACDEESSILDPQNDPQGVEADLAVDPDITEAILIDAQTAIDGLLGPAPAVGIESLDRGVLFAEPDPADVDAARALIEQARQLFERAREAWRHGDAEMAAELALQARLKIAEAMVLVFGEEAYDKNLQRVDQVISWLEQRVDEEASELLDRIKQLKQQAEDIRAEDPTSEDNLIRATERLILALMIGHREQAHQRRQEMAQHARLQVFMGHSALQLAVGVVGDDATEEQVRGLRHTQHLVMHAAQALESGRFELAFHLGREAVNVALVAVMLEPGIEGARVQAMVELAERAISAAEDALSGQDPQGFPARLLEHAKNLQRKGNELAFTHPRVAIHVLWQASVTAYGVIQLVS